MCYSITELIKFSLYLVRILIVCYTLIQSNFLRIYIMENLKIKLDKDLQDFDAKKIKAVAIDIDGTLINDKSLCTERTEKAVKDLIKTGREVYIVTGRAITTAMAFAKQVAIPKYMINYNGGAVWNFELQKREFGQTISPQAGKDILKLIRNYDVMALVYSDDQYYYENENTYLKQYLNRVTVQGHKLSLDELPEGSFQKFFIMGDDDDIQNLYKEVVRLCSDEISVFLTTPGMHNLAHPDTPARCIEIMAYGVNKGNTLKTLLASQNISMDEVVSFGDDTNDIEMLQMSGWGVAMNNARPSVKDAARVETLSHKDDGVAYFIEKYLL